MIVHPARALTRLLALVTLPILGLAAAAFAIAAVLGGRTTADLADAVQLTAAWQEVGAFLRDTAPQGGSTVLLAAGGAILGGLLLLVGALAPAKERELPLKTDGDLTVRRRPLAAAARALAGQPHGVTGTKARVRTTRVGRRGRLRLRVWRSPRVESHPVRDTIEGRLAPLTDAFPVRSRVAVRVGNSRKRRIS